MALNSSEYMTLSDVTKATNGGKAPISLIVDEFSKPLTLLKDLPVRPASDKFEDNAKFLEPWEYNKNSETTDLDSGTVLHKLDTYDRKDYIGYRSTGIGINKKNYIAAGADAKLWRAKQLFELSKHMSLDMEHDFFYGDPTVDVKQTLGLYPRFGVITDLYGTIKTGAHQGEVTPYVCIDGGGTANNGTLGSIFILHMSNESGCCMIHPKDAGEYSNGILYTTGEFTQVQKTRSNGVTEVLYQAADTIEMMAGLSILSRNSAVRIANIDFNSNEGLEKFEFALYQAFETFPIEYQNSLMIYCPQVAVPLMKKFYNSRMKAATYSDAKPQNLTGDFYIDDGSLMFRKTSMMKLTESKIV